MMRNIEGYGGDHSKSRSRRFRDLIAAPELLVLLGAWDALSALLIEQAGFQGVYVMGGGIARSSGVPDIGLITLSEHVARVKMICEAATVPVLANVDIGRSHVRRNFLRTWYTSTSVNVLSTRPIICNLKSAIFAWTEMVHGLWNV